MDTNRPHANLKARLSPIDAPVHALASAPRMITMVCSKLTADRTAQVLLLTFLVALPLTASAQGGGAEPTREQKAALAQSIAKELAKKDSAKAAALGLPVVAGPVEKLFKDRKYADAILEADKLKKMTKGGEPANEYWAARALRGLKKYPEAQERLAALVKNHPDGPFADRARIDGPVMSLAPLKGEVHDAKDAKIALKAAKDLNAVGKRFVAAGNVDDASRAYYIAGNALRMARHDDEALEAYETCNGLTGFGPENEYPLKCMQARAVIASRHFDAETAKRLYTKCNAMDDGRGFRTAQRCRKDRGRMETFNSPAPELDIETWLNGEPVTLAELRGKVVLIFFFATWCPHCKESLPRMPEFIAPYVDGDFQMLAITHNTKDQTTPKAKLFVSNPKWKITYPAAVDNFGNTSVGMAATGIPAAVLIDKKGFIRWSGHPNYLTREMIDKLMAEKATDS